MSKRTTLADQLRKAMKRSGLTTNAIAVESGIAGPVLYRFVNLKRDLALRTADKLARCLGLELRPAQK